MLKNLFTAYRHIRSSRLMVTNARLSTLSVRPFKLYGPSGRKRELFIVFYGEFVYFIDRFLEDEQSVGGGYFAFAVNVGNNGLILI